MPYASPNSCYYSHSAGALRLSQQHLLLQPQCRCLTSLPTTPFTTATVPVPYVSPNNSCYYSHSVGALRLSQQQLILQPQCRCLTSVPKTLVTTATVPVPVAARSKVSVCGRSPAEIVGSNPIGGIDVCLLCVVLSCRGIGDWLMIRTEESYCLW